MPAKKQVPKDMILSAATDLFRQDGMAAVSITGLARRLGCSTQPIYLSFSGMDELKAALRVEVKQYFFRRMDMTPLEQADLSFAVQGLRYIQFAKEEPEIFQFLFMRKKGYAEMKADLLPVMDKAISQITERLHITPEEAHDFYDQLWVYLHGIAAMTANSYCEWDMEKVQGMATQFYILLSAKYGKDAGHES